MQHTPGLDDHAGWELLDRYVAGECAGDELWQMERWMSSVPAARDAVAAMRAVRVDKNVDGIAFKISRPWEIVTRAMRVDEPGEIRPGAHSKTIPFPSTRKIPGGHRSSSALRRMLPYGVVLGIAIATVFVAREAGWRPSAGSASESAQPMRTFATGEGQRARVQFLDGSSVLLAPQSVVRYDENFGTANRIVFIEGQGLFSVVHGSAHPFVVRAGDVETRVLGTSFSVRKYETDHAAEVVVATGKVAVVRQGDVPGRSFVPVTLSTGDGVSVGPGRNPDIRHAVNIAAELAWADGRLAFRETLLRDAIPELRRWYGFDLQVADTRLLDEPITLSLTTERPAQVIALLETVLNAKASRRGLHVVFTPR